MEKFKILESFGHHRTYIWSGDEQLLAVYEQDSKVVVVNAKEAQEEVIKVVDEL